jgi:hypothetical protein
MKIWIGRWLMAVAGAHTLLGAIVFRDPLATLVERGVVNEAGADPAIALAVWFLLFGFALFIGGLAIGALERSPRGQLPVSLGWSLLALAVVGVTLMPMSGFWLAFPPALAIIVRRR